MDLPVNQFKRALREGRPQIGLWSVLANAAVLELLGGAGCNFVAAGVDAVLLAQAADGLAGKFRT